jgi:two-component system, OmpR family, response regulator
MIGALFSAGGAKAMAKVLLIDDDVELVDMLRDYLVQDGFTVDIAHDGESGVRAAVFGDYAIAVIDVMMPRLSGIEVLRRIRTQSPLPVIMLTARGDDLDRILGLELGADDYVAKPCQPREISARLRAILRRGGNAGELLPAALAVGRLVVRPGLRRAEWDGQPLQLTSTEFGLLETLARQAGRPVSKNELSERVLGRPLARYDRSVDVHVSSLRHKLGALADGRSCIQTVYRQGYQLIGED